MGWKANTRTVRPSAAAATFLSIATLLAPAAGCSGRIDSNPVAEERTRSVAQNLGLGATATPFELEVLTTLCTANGREDVFRLINRGTAPVPLSNISFKYWADDTSGQTIVPIVQN